MTQKKLSILLIATLVVLAYQTFTLISLNQRIVQAKLGTTTASTANLPTANASAPNMVGGC